MRIMFSSPTPAEFDPGLPASNPEITALLRTLVETCGPMKISDLIARADWVAQSNRKEDRHSPIRATLKLAKSGLVRPIKGRDRLLYLQITERGRNVLKVVPYLPPALVAASAVSVMSTLSSRVAVSTPVVERLAPVPVMQVEPSNG
jgi:hypothetical protein